MKKLFFIAAIAGAALVSCTKNEVAQSVNEQKAISFSSPVVGATTKASAKLTNGLLAGAYPTDQNFSVWAWYTDFGTYSADNAVAYMTDVEVVYNAAEHDGEDPKSGAWEPNPKYYWPKDGDLTFDAYSPSDIQAEDEDGNKVVTCDKESGITITDYTVPTTISDQIDILFSTRAFDKTTSHGSTANNYEGVDIVFKHALSAIAFKAAQAGSYASGVIKIKSITVKAYSTGTFTQNLGTTDDPSWTASDVKTYTILSAEDYENSMSLTQTLTSAGTDALVLPQVFDENVEITVDYYIKNPGETELLQTKTFELSEDANQGDKDINKWIMGTKYTYNITIGLDDIYFAPTIEDWTTETVTLPSIG